MPIRRVKQDGVKWYWGSRGPFATRKQAESVAKAAYASGYKPKPKANK